MNRILRYAVAAMALAPFLLCPAVGSEHSGPAEYRLESGASAGSYPGRLWCMPTEDPALREQADLCGDGRVFTLMLPDGSVVPLVADDHHVYQELHALLGEEVVVRGWVIETSVLVVTAIEFSRIAVDAGRAVCTAEESATRSTAARLPQARDQARSGQ